MHLVVSLWNLQGPITTRNFRKLCAEELLVQIKKSSQIDQNINTMSQIFWYSYIIKSSHFVSVSIVAGFSSENKFPYQNKFYFRMALAIKSRNLWSLNGV